MLAWLIGAPCGAKHILEQSHNRLTMFHITHQQRRFVMIKIILICCLLFCCYRPVSELNAESETLITAHHSVMQHSHSPLFLSCFPPFLTPNSHFNTHTSASNELLAERNIYRSVFEICLQEPQNIQYIYCIYSSILLLSHPDLTVCVPCSGMSPGC